MKKTLKLRAMLLMILPAVLLACVADQFHALEEAKTRADSPSPNTDADLADGEGGDAGAVGDGGVADACGTVHNNGAGQSFTTCSPVGMFDEAGAVAACEAFGASQGAANPSVDCFLNETTVIDCGVGAQMACIGEYAPCKCWEFYGPNKGHVSTVYGCGCPSSNDPTWN